MLLGSVKDLFRRQRLNSFSRSKLNNVTCLVLLGIGREHGNMLSRNYIGIIFPYSLLPPNKLLCLEEVYPKPKN